MPFKPLAAGLAILLSASSAALAENDFISVTATYRERIAPPPDAVLSIELLDVSRADAPALRLSQQRYAVTGIPMSVELPFDPALIGASSTYAVRGQLSSGETVLFRTENSVPVLASSDDTEATLMLVGVMSADQGGIAGREWVLMELDGNATSEDEPPTLEFGEDDGFSIFGGCNRFNGQASIEGNELAFPAQMAGTLMACPPDREALERNLVSRLTDVRGYAQSGALLELLDEAGHPVMRFRARAG